MNQKGEAILFCVLILTLLSGILTLCGLELQRSYQQLQTRTSLFLCLKQTKGDFDQYMIQMGRTNWMIKNTTKAQFLFMLVPGLQGAGMKASEIKKAIQKYQNILLLRYLTLLKNKRAQKCPLDPQLFLTPFQLSLAAYHRNPSGQAILRKKQWNYLFYSKPYLITMGINLNSIDSPHPKISYEINERPVTLFSPSFSPWGQLPHSF